MNLEYFWKNRRCECCEEELYHEDLLCPDCLRRIEELTFPLASSLEGFRLLSLYHYDGLVRDMLHRMKFRDGRYLSRYFAQKIVRFLRDNEIAPEGVSYIPMHSGKRLRRGFDQAKDLADETARLLGIPSAQLLERTRRTPPLFSLSAKERRALLRGAFRCLLPGEERLWLVLDDISTTGSTMAEAARGLKEGKIANVIFLALAR